MNVAAADPKPLTAIEFHDSRQFVDTEFGRIAYVERGEGPVALLIHGALLNGYQWRHQLSDLSDIRRVIALDTLAMGYTEISANQPLGMKNQARMFKAFLDALGIDSVDLVGNDSGGGAAQVFAANYPDAVRTLTLTNCEVNDYDDKTPGFVQFRQLVESGGLPTALRTLVADPSLRSTTLANAYEHPEKLPQDAISTYFVPLVGSETRIRKVHEYIASTRKEDLLEVEDALRTLDAPVTVLWGTADTFFPVDRAHWLRDNLPNVKEVVEIEGGLVFWPEEYPEFLSEKLRVFWIQNAD